MYSASCSFRECTHEVTDSDFDKVVDALAEHLYEAHGLVWTGEEDTPLAETWSFEGKPTVGRKKKTV